MYDLKSNQIDLDMNDGGHINLKNTNLFLADRKFAVGCGFLRMLLVQFS